VASPEIDIYFRVDITFKALLSSTEDQTKTISFIDRPYPESSEQYIAALEDLSGLGIGVGQSGMPVQSVGSVILSDLPHSLGYERRVSDLLARYTVANQPIVIYASQVGIGEAPSFEQVWSGTGVNASKSGGAEESISIQCKGVSIPVRRMLRAIQESECDEFTQNSIGKVPALPLGSYEIVDLLENGWPCVAYPLASILDGAGFAQSWSNWASRAITSYGPHAARVGLGKAWGRCIDGKYREIVRSDASTPVYASNSAGSNYPSPQGGSEICVKLLVGSPRYIITGGHFWFRGQNNGGITPSGNLVFKLYIGADSTGSTRPDSTHVAIAVVDKATYLTEVRGASDFYVEFTFDQAFVFGGETPGVPGYDDLHLSCTVENFATSLTDFVPGGVTLTGTFLKRDTNGEWVSVIGSYRPLAAVYPVNWVPFVSGPNNDGLYFSCVDFTQKTPATGQKLADLNSLEILMGGVGLADDSYGTITGSANSIIQRPEHILESLSYKWTGEAWESDTSFDWAIYSTAYSLAFSAYPRLVGGVVSQDYTTEDIMGLVCSEHRYNLIQDPLGVITAWPCGYSPEVSAVIDSEESIVTGWNILEPETTINNCKMYFQQNPLTAVNFAGTLIDGFSGYGKSLQFSEDVPLSHSLGAQSRALFGNRDLGSEAFNLIGDSTTAENVGSLILRQHDLPHWIVGLTIPFWKYRALRLMDIIEITSPSLPAFFGTSEAGHLPIYDGDPVEAMYGEYPKRAQRYRCQIIQKNLEYQAGTIPRWDLTVRIISPYHPNEVT